jgi:hypothetical protein
MRILKQDLKNGGRLQRSILQKSWRRILLNIELMKEF